MLIIKNATFFASIYLPVPRSPFASSFFLSFFSPSFFSTLLGALLLCYSHLDIAFKLASCVYLEPVLPLFESLPSTTELRPSPPTHQPLTTTTFTKWRVTSRKNLWRLCQPAADRPAKATLRMRLLFRITSTSRRDMPWILRQQREPISPSLIRRSYRSRTRRMTIHTSTCLKTKQPS